MCEFVSWIELPGKTKDKPKILFLTGKQVFGTEKGKELRDWCQNDEDLTGHGAIRYFYGLTTDQGIDRECTNFKTPTKFPDKIVRSIKNGDMRGLGNPKQLLTEQAWAEYEKIRQPALAEYQKIQQPALDEYRKIEQPALAEYQKIEQPAWDEYRKIREQALAEYEKIREQALAEYEKIQQPAWAEYEKIRHPAWAEYEKIQRQAWAEYQKIEQDVFWDLFSIKENRVSEWR